jgi:hypothetical protein
MLEQMEGPLQLQLSGTDGAAVAAVVGTAVGVGADGDGAAVVGLGDGATVVDPLAGGDFWGSTTVGADVGTDVGGTVFK